MRHRQRFEWTDDGTYQFRELTRLGNHVTVRGGVRIDGADAVDEQHAREIQCSSPDNATRVYNELVADLNYYVPTIEAPERVSTYKPAEHPQLEQQCRDAPDSPEPWLVYADWLIAQSDPIGEIASCAAAGKLAAAKSLIRQHQIDLIGTPDYHMPELEYRHGFVVGATLTTEPSGLHTPLEEITRKFVAGPMSRFVESLRFGLAGFERDNDWSGTLRAVVESPRASQIRALRFDRYDRDDCEISWVAFGDFAFAWDKLPALEHLHIKSGAGGTLGTLDLPRLKTFIRESGGLAKAEIDAIINARWPNLEHLEVWFGSRQHGAVGTVDSIAAMLANDLPKLTHLGIVNCGFVEQVLPLLAASPIFEQLHSLDLSKGVMNERGASAFLRNAPMFRHLASIDLSENLLEEAHVSAIRGVLDNVIIGKQRGSDDNDNDDDGDGDDDDDHYVAIGE